jgi:hypothetical protein
MQTLQAELCRIFMLKRISQADELSGIVGEMNSNGAG